jgi:hypothetical protein
MRDDSRRRWTVLLAGQRRGMARRVARSRRGVAGRSEQGQVPVSGVRRGSVACADRARTTVTDLHMRSSLLARGILRGQEDRAAARTPMPSEHRNQKPPDCRRFSMGVSNLRPLACEALVRITHERLESPSSLGFRAVRPSRGVAHIRDDSGRCGGVLANRWPLSTRPSPPGRLHGAAAPAV